MRDERSQTSVHFMTNIAVLSSSTSAPRLATNEALVALLLAPLRNQLFDQFLELVVGRLLCFLRNGIHRNPQLQRILRTRRSDHCSARVESVGRPHDSVVIFGPSEGASSWSLELSMKADFGGFERQLAMLCELQ